MVVIQDAETGEQLFVDTHDRFFRRFAAAARPREKARCGRRSARPASTRLELSTDDEIVNAIMRFADLRKRAANSRRRRAAASPDQLMTFIWPDLLWTLAIVPALVFCTSGSPPAEEGRAQVREPDDGQGGDGRGQSFRRHVPPVLFLLALIAMIVAIGRPRRSSPSPHGHGDPRDRRLREHARDRRAAQPAGGRPGRGQGVRRRPAHTRIGVVSFAGTAAVVQAPTLSRRTSSPRSTGSSSSAAPRSAAGCSCR